jgi:hypothetical protein
MLSTPTIVQTSAEPAAIIRLTIPRSEMMKQFGPATGELFAALAAQDVQPVGAVFAHHLNMSADTFDFELGVNTAAPVTERARAAGRASGGEGCPRHLQRRL